jgi:hypothetical protein
MKFLAVLILVSTVTFAQKGNSFLTHHYPTDETIDFRSSGMVQDKSGLIYFTNRKGVLEFDGKNWQLIPTPGAVYTLSLLDNEVFVGGVFGFGKLTSNGDSRRSYLPLSTAPEFFSSIVASGKVYACSEGVLLIVNGDKIEKEITPNANDHFTGLLDIHGHAFVKSFSQGLREIVGNELIKPTLILPTDSEILFSSTDAKTGDVLIGTGNSKIYILKEKGTPLEVKPVDELFLQQNKLSSAAWLNENLIACATLLGGVLLIDPVTGTTHDIINFEHGLPDNEVFALMADHYEGIWVAHEYGFTRIAPSIPFRSFNHFEGLSGNLLCVKSINNQVYVGTTLGLFLLSKNDVNEARQASPVKGKVNNKKNLFGFRKSKTDKSISTASVPKALPPASLGTKTEKYTYKKVEGIVGKVSQLIEVNGKLIASGLSGVFEIDNLRATAILLEPVHAVFFSVSLQHLLVGTSQEKLRFFVPGVWKEVNILDTLQDNFSYFFEDEIQNIWLCGRSRVYRIETLEGQVSGVEGFSVANPSLDQMVGVAYGPEVYIAASGEFKRFDRKGSFVRYDSFPGPHRYFASAGYFWFNDGVQWRTVDSRLKSLKLKWLGLFPNLRFLAPEDGGQNLWVITAKNELYKFSNSLAPTEDQHYPLLLRGVHGQQIKIVKDKQVTMDQSENEFSFEFIQPDYVSSHSMQYRYMVKGLTNTWTNWSNSNYVASFPFLPPGTYQLAIQSRDLLGNESKIETISFKILPPYWNRWWFYALEFLFFSMMVFLAVKLSASNSKYRYLSEILSLLTVIIFIQFINTAIGLILVIKSSPVIQFFIQVFVALVIFPLEMYFRKFMRAAAEGKIQIKRKNYNPDNS